jgi:hypothetical protein
MQAGKAGSISDHQQSWGYEEGPSKGHGHALLAAADYTDSHCFCRNFDRLPEICVQIASATFEINSPELTWAEDYCYKMRTPKGFSF